MPVRLEHFFLVEVGAIAVEAASTEDEGADAAVTEGMMGEEVATLEHFFLVEPEATVAELTPMAETADVIGEDEATEPDATTLGAATAEDAPLPAAKPAPRVKSMQDS